MPSVVDCPACHRKLNLPEQLLGQQVRCPTCGETFRGAASAPPMPVPSAPLPVQFDPLPIDEVPLPERPPSASSACPYCGGKLRSPGAHCPYCGERLGRPARADDRPWEGSQAFRRDWEPHRATLVLVLGVMSIALLPIFFPASLPVGIAAWIMGVGDLRKMRQNEMDPAGESSTQAGWICGMIGTILALIPLTCCGFMLVAGMSGP